MSSTLTIDPAQGELRHEAESLAAVLVETGERPARLIGPRGEEIPLPPAIFAALTAIVEALRQGDGVSVIPMHHLLTTYQAAEILNVSRPTLVRLLGPAEEGKIPFEYVGTHRRIRVGEVLACRERREAERREAMQNLVRHGEELDLPY
jgi:excisionase family DNA binding protein